MGRKAKNINKKSGKGPPKRLASKSKSRGPNKGRRSNSSTTEQDSTKIKLARQLGEALEREAATAEILRAIASSPSNVTPIFEAIAERSNKLMNGLSTAVLHLDKNMLNLAAFTRRDEIADAALTKLFPCPVSDIKWYERTIRAAVPVRIEDCEVEFAEEPALLDLSRKRGFRSAFLVPLLRNSVSIGLISVTRAEVGNVSDDNIRLLQTFADQAVIAIENARLFAEVQAKTRNLEESLQQQTATAEVLKVISRSAFDLGSVMNTLTHSAAELCKAEIGVLYLHEGDVLVARGVADADSAQADFLRRTPLQDDSSTYVGRTIIAGAIRNIADVANETEIGLLKRFSEVLGFRSILFVPLMREGGGIGVFALARKRTGQFSRRDVDLVQTFADQAVIAIENVRLFDEVQTKTRDLSEALSYQTGSGKILSVIASSPTEVGPVLKAIVETACELCDASDALVFLKDGEDLRFSAHHGSIPINMEKWPINRNWVMGRTVVDGVPVHVHDLPSEGEEFPEGRELARHQGIRTVLSAPLLREGESIGTIALRRSEVQPFSEKQIALLQTFADQAVIALGNVRLFDEVQAKTRDLTEALTYQTGSGNILKVIASSPTDVKPVLKAIVESACELCDAKDAVVLLKDGDDLRFSAHHGPLAFKSEKQPIRRTSTAGRAFLDREPVHVRDMLSDEGAEFPDTREFSRHIGLRSILSVPLLRDNESIGVIVLRRTEMHPFSDKQIALLRTFADQAVIAIENARLFNETKEALERQTATAEILKVIASSPSDVQPVFEAVVNSAAILFEPCSATITTLKDGKLHWNASAQIVPSFDHEAARAVYPIPFNPDHSPSTRAILERRIIAIPDTNAPDTPEYTRRISAAGGFRSITFVPLIHENRGIGTIILTHPQTGFRFSDKQLALLQTFADQAVIAIENARLFDEVQAKTRDLTEALEQQTATSEILQVISSSQGELDPVFTKLLENATRVCGASFGTMNLYENGEFRQVARYNVPEYLGIRPAVIRPHPESGLATVARTRRVVQIEDIRASAPYREGAPEVRFLADAGARTLFVVPMLRDDELLGTITIYRREVRRFTDQQIELVANFARQAVIAIENARLLRELRGRTDDLSESLQQQTATADVLKVISASPGELEPVFQAMLENAGRLCEAKFAMLLIYHQETDEFHGVGKWNLPPAYGDIVGTKPIRVHPKIPLGRVMTTKQPVHVTDVLLDQSYIEGFPGMVAVAELGGARTLLQVPMLKENELVGTIAIYRQEVRPFTDKQIALVQNFASQAVIAIENARLLNELRKRTDDLTESLNDLRAAQDRLVQTEKLASLGQLTAGIAHEIKNPLNFVNNFSSLSAELIDELNETLAPAPLDHQMRGNVSELTQMLKSNLEKVVQHGKRADSIVKNMLLHSREGSGEQRPADLNALLEESLNLAYHGARAEKPGFNITLQRDLDPNAGAIDVFPQEITRAFINLISNGFYATDKRKTESGASDFEPVLIAVTKNLGNDVEIRIRDNGTGIPAEVQEKMFNPFFTTKPAGEGTGLGLSMTHDIIVKQHGGKIDVSTEPGQFTEFTIVLPRKSNVAGRNGGQT